MLRRTITCGSPLVLLSVSMYCCGDCVCPLSPNGNVPLRNCSPVFAANLDGAAQRKTSSAPPALPPRAPDPADDARALTSADDGFDFAGAEILHLDSVEALVATLPRRSAGISGRPLIIESLAPNRAPGRLEKTGLISTEVTSTKRGDGIWRSRQVAEHGPALPLPDGGITSTRPGNCTAQANRFTKVLVLIGVGQTMP